MEDKVVEIMKSKLSFVLLIIIVSLLAISMVSAADNVTDNAILMDENSSFSISGEILEDNISSSAPKSFTDLNNLINDGWTIDLEDDYSYNPATDLEFVNGIVISRSIAINGNGHVIDGKSQARIFNVTNYVSFNNITFINAKSDIGSAITGSNYAVMDSKFINNVATDSGGAVSGGNIINCIFQSNSANKLGGAVYQGSVDNCIFLSNSANEGGAIYDVYATGSTFENNYASSYGGAMRGSSARDCIFIGNSARLYSGAVFDAYLNHCTFINNTATTGGAISGGSNSAVNCIFEGNSAEDGGAVYGYVVLNSIFRYNHANHGGCMYTGSARSCIFEYNYAIDKGGALMGAYADSCNFTYNHASKGGAMFQNSAKDCIFTSNYAVDGGAMFNSHAENCKFRNNNASEGGAIYEGGAESSDFRYNYAINGGAVAVSDVLACTFINNTANDYGGAAYKTSARRSYFSGNVAKYGGALSVSSSASECVFKYNTAKITGGARYDAFIADSEFEGNLPRYKLYVSDFSAIEGFGGDFYINLYDSVDYPVHGVNATIKVYNSKNKLIKTQICECGYSWFVNFAAGKYKAIISIDDVSYEIDPVTVSITIKKSSFIYVVNVATSYGAGKNLVINLHDSVGTIIKYAKISVNLNGATKTYTTDDNGQVIISTKSLIPKTYVVSISYAGSATYVNTAATAKIVVKKVSPLLTAAKKSFKLKVRTKSYTVTLKTNKKVAMRSTKVTLKVNGRTYSAKTNSLGQATFKIVNLNKKGNFRATVSYAGNSIYNAITRTAIISVVR